MKNSLSALLLICLLPGLLLISSCKKDDDSPNPNLNKLAVGESANDILAADNYDQLVLEIIAVDGYELPASTLSSFQSFLEARINKPGGITVKTSSISDPGLAPYSATDLRDFEDEYRTEFNEGSELKLFIFITEDAYTDNNVLGVAYRNTSFAIMGGRIKDLTGGFGQPSEELVLQTVLRHEAAHLFGLVNVGTAMQTDHQDDAHGNHCDVQGCLMYYAVETGDFLSNLLGQSSPPELDAQCIADLQANGGK